MNKIMALIIAAAMLVPYAGTSLSASAATSDIASESSLSSASGVMLDTNKISETSGDFEYTVLDDGSVEITKYSGSEAEVVIPSEIDDKSVTSINNSIFYTHFTLTSVTIPASVTSIGEFSLRNCSSLTSINVDADNKVYSSIDGVLYNKEQTELLLYPKAATGKTYTFPDSVTSIAAYAFYMCGNLQSINVPGGVTTIGEHAFSSCIGLTSVTLSEGITAVPDYAFISCNSLKEVTIPSSVVSVGYNSFGSCMSITDVNYAGTMEEWGNIEVGEGNFYLTAANIHASDSDPSQKSDFVFTLNDDGTLRLSSYVGDGGDVVIPKSFNGKRVTIIEDAFMNCENLTSVVIPNTVKEIWSGAFVNCVNLTSVTMSDKVKMIEPSVFGGCHSLKSITLPSNLTAIYDSAFYGCYSLTDITIPDSVTYIGYCAFERCTALESITIPKNVETIGEGVFEGCENLNNIYVDENNEYYSSVDGVLFNKEQTDLIAYPPNRQGEFALPNTVTTIDAWDFAGISGLTKVIIPESVTTIESEPFYRCTDLREIEVDENNENYSSVDGVMYNKDKTSIIAIPMGYEGELNVPATVTEITISPYVKYEHMTAINVDEENLNYSSVNGILYDKDITEPIACPTGYKGEFYIPASVTTINNRLIYRCLGITSYNVDAENQNFASVEGVLFNKDKTTLLSCPTAYQGEYVVPNGVKSISDAAFYNCRSLTKVTIPAGVTYIGYSAFYGCVSLTSANIPEGVTKIYMDTFSDCSSLTDLEIPDSVTEIDPYVFARYSEETSYLDSFEGDFVILGNGILYHYKGEGGDVIIPDGVKVINTQAFFSCDNITSVTIPEGVTEIPEYIFSWSESLTSVTIPTSVVSIDQGAFEECAKLSDVYYTGSEEEWDKIEIAEDNYSLNSATVHFDWEVPDVPDTPDTPDIPDTPDTPDTPDEPIGIYGDMSGDGRISSVDALLVLRSIAGLDKLSDEEKVFADVNCDGRVTSVDALEILRYCAGYTPTTSIGEDIYPN